MGYTASDALERITLKAWTSTSRAMTDGQLLTLLEDSLRSYVVPLMKGLREEFLVQKDDVVLTSDSNGEVTVPDSVASTLRTVSWLNAGVLIPLTRIEPESAFAYQPAAGNQPAGYMLRGYTMVLLPRSPNIAVHISVMRRPPSLVLEDDAGLIDSHVGLALTLDAVPLAWQSAPPSTVDLVSKDSPFSPKATDVAVASLVGNVLTLSGISSSLVADGDWVSDPGSSPYPNLPIELHPLLEQHVIVVLMTGLGDKRLQGAAELLKKYEDDVRRTMAPRSLGTARPLLNPTAPGMRYGRWWYGR